MRKRVILKVMARFIEFPQNSCQTQKENEKKNGKSIAMQKKKKSDAAALLKNDIFNLE